MVIQLQEQYFTEHIINPPTYLEAQNSNTERERKKDEVLENIYFYFTHLQTKNDTKHVIWTNTKVEIPCFIMEMFMLKTTLHHIKI